MLAGDAAWIPALTDAVARILDEVTAGLARRRPSVRFRGIVDRELRGREVAPRVAGAASPPCADRRAERGEPGEGQARRNGGERRAEEARRRVGRGHCACARDYEREERDGEPVACR
jgi:hypothetical protein